MTTLTPRDRAICAIKHQAVDMVPWNIELTTGFAEKVRLQYPGQDPELALGNHLLRKKYKNNRPGGNGRSIDLFGVEWQDSTDGGDVGNITHYPLLDTEDDFGDYRFPAVDKALANSLCDALEGEQERFTMFGITMGYFERAWSLRGMENALADMILYPAFTQELYDRILEHHLQLLDTVLDRRFDAVYIGDDWGQQQGLIMGPAMWRKYIKPAFCKLFDAIKARGKLIVLHSCGDLRELLPELIEMGLDVYNTVQPEIYDLPALIREYGKDLCFYGGISTQQFLPYATPEEVRRKTREVLSLMGDGGYILSPTHAVTPDIPVANVEAMIGAAKQYFGVDE